MTKKLLQEYFELCPDGNCALEVMTENEKRKVVNEGAIYLVGVCQRAGVKNGNGRIYKKDTLRREVEAYQKAIKERAPQSTTSVEEVVPTIVVTPEAEPDVETSVTKVPEKE